MKLPTKPRAYLSGGGSGLGRAIALELARRGGRVLIAEVNLEAAERTAADVRALGGEAIVRRCDVTSVADVEACADELQRAWGGVDLVVNNAGVAAGGGVGEFPLSDWEWIVRVNLWGVIHGCHVFAPRLRAQGTGGFILNVASAAGIATFPEMGAYNVTKAGVISLSETLFAELGPERIGVSVLCPTFFASDLMSSFRSPSPRQRRLAEAMFRRSKWTAEEVSQVALRGLERGKLHILPQWDAKLVWAMKRFLPGLYMRGLRRKQEDFVKRLLARERK